MKLYYNPLSTFAQKALIALYEKQVAFEPVLVNLGSPEAKAEYQKIYPIGKVPMLKPSEDHMIPESSIIIEYLDGHYQTGTRLIPDGVDAARKVRFMDRMSDLYLDEPVVKLLFQKIGIRSYSEDDIAQATKYVRISYEAMEKHLEGKDWLCGEFSMADCAAIPPLFYAQNLASFSDYRNVVAYYERAKQRPSYVKVLAELVPAWQSMQSQSKKG
jgi:glutathione S-transferase